jgi:peptidoglycan/xylan/chitin deacetylase (PgdA/CDA1 family)
VRVLTYHRVSDEPDELAVSPVHFSEQMAILRDSDFEIRRLCDALDAPDLGRSRTVCVTFDDGYRDNLTNALPVLREHGVPATIFLPTAIIDGEERYRWYADPPAALTWDEVRELQREGLVDFQAHTVTHPLLPGIDDDQARIEIVTGRGILEQRLGREVTCLCYPGGRYGEREMRLAEEAGYRLAVTTRPGVNGPGTPVFALRRTVVHGEDDAARFRSVLHGGFDHRDRLPAALRRLRVLPPG